MWYTNHPYSWASLLAHLCRFNVKRAPLYPPSSESLTWPRRPVFEKNNTKCILSKTIYSQGLTLLYYRRNFPRMLDHCAGYRRSFNVRGTSFGSGRLTWKDKRGCLSQVDKFLKKGQRFSSKKVYCGVQHRFKRKKEIGAINSTVTSIDLQMTCQDNWYTMGFGNIIPLDVL